jgi:RHS repeat-associated protein
MVTGPALWGPSRKYLRTLLILSLMVGFFGLALGAEAASAAECTDTWTGPAEGNWGTAANWSAEHVPTESDVACIAAGKTVTVTSVGHAGVVQGEGAVVIAGGWLEVTSTETTSELASLTLSGGVLDGHSVAVTESFTWLNTASLTGPGSTVIRPGATGTISSSRFGVGLEGGHHLVNEGSLTLAEGEIDALPETLIENIGTFDLDSQNSPGIGGSYLARVANLGTFRKASGVGVGTISIPFTNLGTVRASTGTLDFAGGASTETPNLWEAASGSELIFSKEVTLDESTLIGSVEIAEVYPTPTTVELIDVEAAEASIDVVNGGVQIAAGATSIGNLTLPLGSSTVYVAGTLEVSGGLTWNKGEIHGPGSLVLLPGSESSIALTAEALLFELDLVNEGHVSDSTGILRFYGSTLVNKGTFTVNSESEWALQDWGGTNLIVNDGTFQKTSGGGSTSIQPPFENLGAIREATGHLKIEHKISVLYSTATPGHCETEEPVDCATGNFTTDPQTDLRIGGRGVGLDLTRTYSAQAAAAGSTGIFGPGWSNSFGDHLTSEESGAKETLTDSSGGTTTFTKSGAAYLAPPWSRDKLTGSSEAGFVLALPDQIEEAFSGAGRLEGVTDRDGNETVLGYGGSGRLETITDPTGRTITLTYNGAGLVESAEDPMGHVVHYTYESGNLKTVKLPAESSPNWAFGYDGLRRMTSMIDGRGGETTNEYDGSSRVVKQVDPAKHEMTFAYASFQTTITNQATGAVTHETFNSNNQPVSITHGSGAADATTEAFGYTAAGLLARRTDGNGHTTTYEYDAHGNRIKETDREGDETKWTFNEAHQVLSETKPNGEKTTIVRDGDGNPETVSRPAPKSETQTVAYEYGPHGEVEAMTDPLGDEWTYGYDAHGDLESETDPEGDERTWSYDEDSRVTSTVSPRGNEAGAEPAKFTTAIERDPQGRPLKITDPAGGVTEYSYDPDGNVESVTDLNGHTTTFGYNADNERTKVERPSGAVEETGYDGAGQVTSQADGDKHKTTYVRNVLEQPIETINPLERKTIRTFDAAGNLLTKTDADGRVTTYGYDEADRLKEISYSAEAGQDVTLGYDEDSNVTSMADGTGTSTYEYDQLDRLTRSEDGNGETVSWEYNLGDEPVGLTYPSGKSISRLYDADGRPESITDWLGHTTSFGYNEDSALTATTFPVGTGDTDQYAYDHADRMSGVTMKKGAETLASLAYTRDPAGQVESLISKGLPGAETESFSYDENERLTKAGTSEYEYNAANNQTKAPGTTNAFDNASQLETATGSTFTYDKEGERTERTPSSGPATTYKYDQAGDLTAIERPEEGATPAIAESFGYDGTGLMASRTAGLSTKHFVWDLSGSPELLLSDGEDSYVYGPSGLAVEAISAGEVPTYLHHDQLGSTRLLTDGSGEVAGTFTYGAYGALAGHTGSATTVLGYAGEYTLGQSGLQYLRARLYDPATAQFLTRDPAVEITRRPYAYGEDNPLRFVDPTGRECERPSVSIGGFYIGSLPVPTSADCLLGGAEEVPEKLDEVAASPIGGPLITIGCIALDCEPLVAFASGVAVTTAHNASKEAEDPCFNFAKGETEGLIGDLAGFLVGGTVDAGLRAGGSAVASPIAERLIRIWGDAAGGLLGASQAIGER